MLRKQVALAALALGLLAKVIQSSPLIGLNVSSTTPSVDYVTVEVNSTRSNDVQIFEPKPFSFSNSTRNPTTKAKTDSTRHSGSIDISTVHASSIRSNHTARANNSTDSEKHLSEEASQNHENWLTFDGLSPDDYKGPRIGSETYDTRASDREFQQIATDRRQQLRASANKSKQKLATVGLVSHVEEEETPVEAVNRQVTASTTLDDGKRRARVVNKSGPIPAAMRKNIIESFVKNGGKPDNIVVGDSTITTTSQTKKKTITTVYKFEPQVAGPAAVPSAIKHPGGGQTKARLAPATSVKPAESPKQRRTTTDSPRPSQQAKDRRKLTSNSDANDDSDETYKTQAELGEFYRGPKETLSGIMEEINLHDRQAERASLNTIGRPQSKDATPVIKSKRIVEQQPKGGPNATRSTPRPKIIKTAPPRPSSPPPPSSSPQLPPSKVGRRKQSADSKRQTARPIDQIETTTTTSRPKSGTGRRTGGNSTSSASSRPTETQMKARSARVSPDFSPISRLGSDASDGRRREKSVGLGTRRRLDSTKSDVEQPDSLEELKKSLVRSDNKQDSPTTSTRASDEEDNRASDNSERRKALALSGKKKTREALKGGSKKQQVQHNLIMVIDFGNGLSSYQTSKHDGQLESFSRMDTKDNHHASGSLPPAMVNVQIINSHPGHKADESKQPESELVARLNNEDHREAYGLPLLQHDVQQHQQQQHFVSIPTRSELLKFNLDGQPFEGQHFSAASQLDKQLRDHQLPMNIEFSSNPLAGRPTNEIVREIVGQLIQRSVMDQTGPVGDTAASQTQQVGELSSGDLLLPQGALMAANYGLLSPVKAR